MPFKAEVQSLQRLRRIKGQPFPVLLASLNQRQKHLKLVLPGTCMSQALVPRQLFT